jgi:hypothetical protein
MAGAFTALVAAETEEDALEIVQDMTDNAMIAHTAEDSPIKDYSVSYEHAFCMAQTAEPAEEGDNL